MRNAAEVALVTCNAALQRTRTHTHTPRPRATHTLVRGLLCVAITSCNTGALACRRRLTRRRRPPTSRACHADTAYAVGAARGHHTKAIIKQSQHSQSVTHRGTHTAAPTHPSQPHHAPTYPASHVASPVRVVAPLPPVLCEPVDTRVDDVLPSGQNTDAEPHADTLLPATTEGAAANDASGHTYPAGHAPVHAMIVSPVVLPYRPAAQGVFTPVAHQWPTSHSTSAVRVLVEAPVE